MTPVGEGSTSAATIATKALAVLARLARSAKAAGPADNQIKPATESTRILNPTLVSEFSEEKAGALAPSLDMTVLIVLPVKRQAMTCSSQCMAAALAGGGGAGAGAAVGAGARG